MENTLRPRSQVVPPSLLMAVESLWRCRPRSISSGDDWFHITSRSPVPGTRLRAAGASAVASVLGSGCDHVVPLSDDHDWKNLPRGVRKSISRRPGLTSARTGSLQRQCPPALKSSVTNSSPPPPHCPFPSFVCHVSPSSSE